MKQPLFSCKYPLTSFENNLLHIKEVSQLISVVNSSGLRSPRLGEHSSGYIHGYFQSLLYHRGCDIMNRLIPWWI